MHVTRLFCPPLNPQCERGASLEQVYRIVMLSQVCVAHIFCPPLNSYTGRRGRLGVLMPETGDGTPGLPTSRVIPQKACYGAVQVVINV